MPGGMSGLQILAVASGNVLFIRKMSRFVGLSDVADPLSSYSIFDLATELGSKMVATRSRTVHGGTFRSNRRVEFQNRFGFEKRHGDGFALPAFGEVKCFPNWGMFLKLINFLKLRTDQIWT